MKYLRNDDASINVQLFNKIEDGDDELVSQTDYNCSTLPEVNQLRGLAYGISKLMAERTSELSPSQDKLDGIQEVWDALATGEWERPRKAGTGPTVRIEIEALAAIRKITVKQAQTLIKKYDKDAQEKIFANPAVQKVVAKLQAAVEKTDEDVSFDDLIPAEDGTDPASAPAA